MGVRCPAILKAEPRLQGQYVWDIVDFLVNAALFVAAQGDQPARVGLMTTLGHMAEHPYDMVSHMKTTLSIPDPVMARLRAEAARRGVPMSELVEAALRRLLDEPAAPLPAPPVLPRWDSGGLLVDIADREALYRRMEED